MAGSGMPAPSVDALMDVLANKEAGPRAVVTETVQKPLGLRRLGEAPRRGVPAARLPGVAGGAPGLHAPCGPRVAL